MKNASELIVGYLPNICKIVFLETKSFKLSKEDVMLLLGACIESVKEINQMMDQVVEKAFKERFELQMMDS